MKKIICLISALIVSAMMATTVMAATPTQAVSCPNLPAGTYKANKPITDSSGNTWILWNSNSGGSVTLPQDFSWPNPSVKPIVYETADGIPHCENLTKPIEFVLDFRGKLPPNGYSCVDAKDSHGTCDTNKFQPTQPPKPVSCPNLPAGTYTPNQPITDSSGNRWAVWIKNGKALKLTQTFVWPNTIGGPIVYALMQPSGIPVCENNSQDANDFALNFEGNLGPNGYSCVAPVDSHGLCQTNEYQPNQNH